jgi:glycosyltransferase involved in cell wall biosynthesis
MIEPSTPIITIITVVYNGVKHIEDTIQSVLTQHYPNLRFVVIDGGSTDGTIDILKKYDERLEWISEPDAGIYDAMNKGWVKGDVNSFILFLGAGDRILKLPDMHKFDTADVIYGNVYLGERRKFSAFVGLTSFFGNTIHHQALLIKKAIHVEPPFSLAYKVYADFDFNQRLLKSGVKFWKDEEFLGYALEGGVSSEINVKECLEVVKNNYGLVVSWLGYLFYKLQKVNEFRKNNSRNRSI